jgi:hypothetical protein
MIKKRFIFQNNSQCSIVNMGIRLSKRIQQLSNSTFFFRFEGPNDQEKLLRVASDAREQLFKNLERFDFSFNCTKVL